MSNPRTTYARAQQYDPAFERALVDEIGATIATASVCSDANVMAVRTGETIAALVTVLAGVIALTPAATRSPTALRRMVDEIAKHLRVQATQAAADPDIRAFRERVFNGTDIGGHA
jgi:hypothetical protein